MRSVTVENLLSFYYVFGCANDQNIFMKTLYKEKRLILLKKKKQAIHKEKVYIPVDDGRVARMVHHAGGRINGSPYSFFHLGRN